MESGSIITIAHFIDNSNSKFMMVRDSYHASDWDNTIMVCVKCKYNADQRLTRDYIQISCSNKIEYKTMLHTNWCSLWEPKTDF